MARFPISQRSEQVHGNVFHICLLSRDKRVCGDNIRGMILLLFKYRSSTEQLTDPLLEIRYTSRPAVPFSLPCLSCRIVTPSCYNLTQLGRVVQLQYLVESLGTLCYPRVSNTVPQTFGPVLQFLLYSLARAPVLEV